MMPGRPTRRRSTASSCTAHTAPFGRDTDVSPSQRPPAQIGGFVREFFGLSTTLC
jgi:hypothetical protein